MMVQASSQEQQIPHNGINGSEMDCSSLKSSQYPNVRKDLNRRSTFVADACPRNVIEISFGTASTYDAEFKVCESSESSLTAG